MAKIKIILFGIICIGLGFLLGNTNTFSKIVKAAEELWTSSGSNIYRSSGYVGIGDTTPGVKLDIGGTTDANGTANTGLLQVGGTLRIDGNEIITNTGTKLALQAGNNGDLKVDSGTFFVDASADRIGIATDFPASKLHVYQNGIGTGSSIGLTLEQDGTGDTATQYLLTGGTRWATGIDNSDSDKFKIGQGSGWTSGPYLIMTTGGNVIVKLGN